jgi:uncharacterized protein (DUF1684 family)
MNLSGEKMWERWTVILLGCACLGSGCYSTSETVRNRGAVMKGPDDWVAWQAKRRESLAGTNGWTTLIARHWLTPGDTFIGSSPTNQVVLPAGRAPQAVGRVTWSGRQVHFTAAEGVTALIDGQAVRSAELISDANQAPTRLMMGSISLVVIERGERLGLRVRDPEAPARRRFQPPECFPYDPAWRLPGRFEAFAAARTLRVDDVLGGTQELKSTGVIVFAHSGREWRLEVVEEPGEEDYFVIFRDTTAGKSTYGSGRFLYVGRANPAGEVTIDFNRAYTPPCGYTAFATCPLPPRQNWLPFAVPAGEKKPGNELNK